MNRKPPIFLGEDRPTGCPAMRGTPEQTLSAIIGDAFNGGGGVLCSGDWAAYNVFDGFDRLLTTTDAAGGILLNTYDPGGRVIATQTLGSPGGPTPSDRSGSGNVTLASDAARFDELGRQYETQRNVFLDGGIYYGSGTLLGLPSGRTVTHTGGGLAANSTTNNHTGTVTLTAGGTSYVLGRRVFDRIGRVSAAATDNGAVNTTAFDGADRAITKTDALNNVVSYTFDGNSNVTAVTRTDACTISGSIPTESFGALMCYDVMNRLVIQAGQGADGTLTNYFPTPGSATIYTLMGYDSRGNRTNVIDPKLNTTVFDFDGASRLLQTDQHLRTGGVGTNAITATVSTYQTFDANSNLTKLTDSNGGATWFYYDTLDRQTSLVFYDGSTRVYGYDLASDVTGYTDENGSSFTNTFDVLGRKTAVGITLAAGVVGTTAQSFQFDGLSRMTFARDSVSSANADTGFTFDSISRVLEEQQAYSGDTRYVTHNAWTSYPATGFTFPNSRQTTAAFDALYRMNAISETSDSSSIAAWNFFGDRVATVALGNGLACSFMNNAQTRSAIQSGQTTPGWGSITTDQLGYDGAGRLIGKRYFNGSSVLVGFTTAYDLSSNKLFERPLHAESRAALYDSYDSMNRLLVYQRGTLNSGGASLSSYIALPGTNQEQAYNLDALGNWSTTTITPEGGAAAVQNRTHNLLNQVTAYGVSPTSTPVYYDQGNNSGTPPQKGNGNIINDGVRTYAYDALNRLSIVGAVGAGQVAAYAYDALGRRIIKNVSGAIVGSVPTGIARFLYDAERLVEELASATGSTTVQYVWGGYIDGLIQLNALATIGPQPISVGNYYLLSDTLYRSAALTDNSVVVAETYDTDAYGNTLLLVGPGMDGAWFTNDDLQATYSACRYVFTGREYDAESRLYFYRARYYLPPLGRFASRDPIGIRVSGNPYEFCDSRPAALLDPRGKKAGHERDSRSAAPGEGCTCGPNITYVLPALFNFLSAKIAALGKDDLTRLYTSVFASAGSSSGWDITGLKQQTLSSPDCGTGTPNTACEGTVTIEDKCYADEEVNYILFGMVAQMLAANLKKNGDGQDVVHVGWADVSAWRILGVGNLQAGSRDLWDIFGQTDQFINGTLGRPAMYQSGTTMTAQGIKMDTSVAITGCKPCKGRYTSLAGVEWNPPAIEPELQGFIGGSDTNNTPAFIPIDIAPQLPHVHRLGEPQLP